MVRTLWEDRTSAPSGVVLGNDVNPDGSSTFMSSVLMDPTADRYWRAPEIALSSSQPVAPSRVTRVRQTGRLTGCLAFLESPHVPKEATMIRRHLMGSVVFDTRLPVA